MASGLRPVSESMGVRIPETATCKRGLKDSFFSLRRCCKRNEQRPVKESNMGPGLRTLLLPAACYCGRLRRHTWASTCDGVYYHGEKERTIIHEIGNSPGIPNMHVSAASAAVQGLRDPAYP